MRVSVWWKSLARGLLLWAAGLRDLRDVSPGEGNTAHCFNDFNHVDATTMTLDVSDNENRGQVDGIAFGNRLGPGIRVASMPDAGPGGTWRGLSRFHRKTSGTGHDVHIHPYTMHSYSGLIRVAWRHLG